MNNSNIVKRSDDDDDDALAALQKKEKVQQLFELVLKGDADLVLNTVSKDFLIDEIREISDGWGKKFLHYAAQSGSVELCASALDQYKIEVDSADKKGATPLDDACLNGNKDVIEFLISRGADALQPDRSGALPLHYAARSGNTKILKKFINITISLSNAQSSLNESLILALDTGNVECVKLLLESGADANTYSNEGMTSLMLASLLCLKDVANTLIEHGADVNLRIKGVNGETALHFASAPCLRDKEHMLDIVKLLLNNERSYDMASSHKARVQKPSPFFQNTSCGDLPIHSAAHDSNKEVVQCLFQVTDKPGDIDISDWNIEFLLSPKNIKKEDTFEVEHIPEAECPDEEVATKYKNEGDLNFRSENFEKAAEFYTAALKHKTVDARIWANRSAARLEVGDVLGALKDAQIAKKLDPAYVKAFYREGHCFMKLCRWEDAAVSFFEGMQLGPTNKQLDKNFKEAIAQGRKEHQQQKKEKGK